MAILSLFPAKIVLSSEQLLFFTLLFFFLLCCVHLLKGFLHFLIFVQLVPLRIIISKALDDYNKAIELDPSFAFAYNGRGNVYRGFGERQKALDDYNKAIELDPSFAYAYNGRGNVYSDPKS